jgi:hypothetical protein
MYCPFQLTTKITEGNKTPSSSPAGFLRESPPYGLYSLEKACLIYSPSVLGVFISLKGKNNQGV